MGYGEGQEGNMQVGGIAARVDSRRDRPGLLLVEGMLIDRHRHRF